MAPNRTGHFGMGWLPKSLRVWTTMPEPGAVTMLEYSPDTVKAVRNGLLVGIAYRPYDSSCFALRKRWCVCHEPWWPGTHRWFVLRSSAILYMARWTSELDGGAGS
jgi:hypothetical protein